MRGVDDAQAKCGPWDVVGRVVVEDHMHLVLGQDFCDGVEKADEFLMSMALHATADDPAFEHVESGKQCGCAIALIVVGSGAS
jgi:hypothetical protein